MGYSVRRLLIYYYHNVRLTHVAAMLTFLLLIWWLYGPLHSDHTSAGGRIVKSPYGVVHYKAAKETEKMTADEIQKILDSLVDTRPYQCHHDKYDFTRLENSAPVSIILDFHGASFYDLKLSLSSIVENTPYDLYTEIIILDDGTKDEKIRKHAVKFLQDPKFNKAKIFRSEAYHGQSSAWFKSSVAAVGNFLVFVDSSVVVGPGWLQPLLSKLIDDENLVVVPHVNNILDDNRFFRTDDSLVNIVTWSMSTIYYQPPPGQAGPTDGEMLDTPVARGDVIAVTKTFLNSIGGFDDGLRPDAGSGQFVEFSLRTWLCGGAVRVVSCSHVAVRNALRQRRVAEPANFRRIAELWFDDYRSIAYRQGLVDDALAKDEASSLKLRRGELQQVQRIANKCKPFSWYLENVASSVIVPSDQFRHFGKLRAKTNYCVYARDQRPPAAPVVEMDLCREYMYEPDAMFEMNSAGLIFRGDRCLVPSEVHGANGGRVVFETCNEDDPNQKWIWSGSSRLTVKKSPNLCLVQVSDRDQETMELHHYVRLQKCLDADADVRKQIWKFLKY